jgi:hypothetical protein
MSPEPKPKPKPKRRVLRNTGITAAQEARIRRGLASAGFPDGIEPEPPLPPSPMVVGLQACGVYLLAKKLAEDVQRLPRPMDRLTMASLRDCITQVRTALDFIESAIGNPDQGWDEALENLG